MSHLRCAVYYFTVCWSVVEVESLALRACDLDFQERRQRLYHDEAHQNIRRIKKYLTLLLYFSDSN